MRALQKNGAGAFPPYRGSIDIEMTDVVLGHSFLYCSSSGVLSNCPFAIMMARLLKAGPCQGRLSRVTHTVSIVRPVRVDLIQ